MKSDRARLASLLLPVIFAGTALPYALIKVTNWGLRFLANLFNSPVLNNLHFHLFSHGPIELIFSGLIMLSCAGLCALMLRAEGVLKFVIPPGRLDRNMLEITLLVSVLYLVGAFLYAYLLYQISGGELQNYRSGQDYILAPNMHLAAVFSIGFAAPFAEEFLFRGALMGVLFARGWRPVWVIVFSSLVFALLHIQYTFAGMFYVFLGGCGFGFLRWKAGGLMSPILAHMMINMTILQLNAIFG